MAHKACDIAKYLLSLVDQDAGDSLTNLKLQKLLYYAQGFHLAIFGKALFREDIEAWEYGPVVPSLYHSLKKFGSEQITQIGDGSPAPSLTKNEIQLLNEVNLVYGQFSALKLMRMTHEEPPWREVHRGAVISHRSMQDYFKTRIVKSPK